MEFYRRHLLWQSISGRNSSVNITFLFVLYIVHITDDLIRLTLTNELSNYPMTWQQFNGFSLNCCHLNMLLVTWWIFFLSISLRDVIYEPLNIACSSELERPVWVLEKTADSFGFSRITISGFWLVDFHLRRHRKGNYFI